MTEVLLPIRTWSEPNLRGHWARRARRAHKQREAAQLFVRVALASLPPSKPVRDRKRKFTVWLTRLAPRELDSDNLVASLKAIRDGVADALDMDDGDRRIEWRYAQRKGKPGEYSVLVELQ